MLNKTGRIFETSHRQPQFHTCSSANVRTQIWPAGAKPPLCLCRRRFKVSLL